MKMKLALFVIALGAAVALFWAFNPARGTEVKTVTPVMAPAVQAVYATGTVEASLMIPISPKIGARLMTLEVDEGSRVEEGQILAQLEDADIRQNVSELKARATLAQKDLTRAQKLAKTGAISKESLDTATANAAAATASLERAKAELGYLKLFAPEAGTIIRRDGEMGEQIAAGTPVFWMTGGDAMRIETEVDEEDIGLVQPGQTVVIRADAFPNQVFEGEVQSITPKGDPVSRSYRVRVSLEQNSPLMIGMTAETNIITKEKDAAMMVPATSVKGSEVLKIKDGKAVASLVTTGIKTPDAVEILEGVSEGEAVAVNFDSTLMEKSRLRAKPAKWAPAKAK
ncbi:MAG TPA: efflux RND transporter periplasmic adaptor subunit [Micavibrio sp.]|nr:efflux RND transporter periplasmic adaptor subunit [Micavibrio sp.]